MQSRVPHPDLPIDAAGSNTSVSAPFRDGFPFPDDFAEWQVCIVCFADHVGAPDGTLPSAATSGGKIPDDHCGDRDVVMAGQCINRGA